jgi:hypothetical protein
MKPGGGGAHVGAEQRQRHRQRPDHDQAGQGVDDEPPVEVVEHVGHHDGAEQQERDPREELALGLGEPGRVRQQ